MHTIMSIPSFSHNVLLSLMIGFTTSVLLAENVVCKIVVKFCSAIQMFILRPLPTISVC